MHCHDELWFPELPQLIICFETPEINTKITLLWTRKQFATSIILHLYDVMYVMP